MQDDHRGSSFVDHDQPNAGDGAGQFSKTVPAEAPLAGGSSSLLSSAAAGGTGEVQDQTSLGGEAEQTASGNMTDRGWKEESQKMVERLNERIAMASSGSRPDELLSDVWAALQCIHRANTELERVEQLLDAERRESALLLSQLDEAKLEGEQAAMMFLGAFRQSHPGWTALHEAARQGCNLLLRGLLTVMRPRLPALLAGSQATSGTGAEHPALPFMAAPPPPLHVAAAAGNATGVRLLIEAGAPLEATTGGLGQAALLYAVARRADVAVIRTLLDAGANLNALDKEGRSALHLAVEERQTETLALLLRECKERESPVDDLASRLLLGEETREELPGVLNRTE